MMKRSTAVFRFEYRLVFIVAGRWVIGFDDERSKGMGSQRCEDAEARTGAARMCPAHRPVWIAESFGTQVRKPSDRGQSAVYLSRTLPLIAGRHPFGRDRVARCRHRCAPRRPGAERSMQA
ncbi:hypothetical protein CKO41_14430 [Thiococcus pfennigii]|nr:hypothetical protein [Thiococcus pfennigii]